MKPYTEIFAWGNDQYGQLGISNKNSDRIYSIPRKCSFDVIIYQISCGCQHSAFIASNGYIYTMGNNEDGRLGISQVDVKCSFSPVLVETLSRQKAIKVSCGWTHTAALVDTGEVFTWGLGLDGQLGNNSKNSEYTPQLVNFDAPFENEQKIDISVIDIECSGNQTFILLSNNKVCCFGSSRYGQLGLGSSLPVFTPTFIPSLSSIIKIAPGYTHTLFLTETREVFATGDNRNGQLGMEFPKTFSLAPLKISTLKNIIQLAASNFSAALSSSGDLYIWGAQDKIYNPSESPFKEENNDRMRKNMQENHKRNLWIPKIINPSTQISNISLGNGFGIGVGLELESKIVIGADSSRPSLGNGMYRFDPDVLEEMNFFEGKSVYGLSCGEDFGIALGESFYGKEDENENKKRKIEALDSSKDKILSSYEKSEKKSYLYDKIKKERDDSLLEKQYEGIAIENILRDKTMKYLSKEEIKERQKMNIYDSPHRIKEEEYEYKPGHIHSSQKKNICQTRQNYKVKSLHFNAKSIIQKDLQLNNEGKDYLKKMKFEDYYETIQPIDDLKKQLIFLQASLDEIQNKYFSLEENYYTLEKEKNKEISEIKKEKNDKERDFERNLKEMRLEFETHFDECENIKNNLLTEIDGLKQKNNYLIDEAGKRNDIFMEKENELEIAYEQINELEKIKSNYQYTLKKNNSELIYYQDSHQKLLKLEESYEHIQSLLESKEIELENSEQKIQNLLKRNEYLEKKLIGKRKSASKKTLDEELEPSEEQLQLNEYSRITPSENNNSTRTVKRLERIDLSPNCYVSSRNIYASSKYNKYKKYVSPNQDSKEHCSIDKQAIFNAELNLNELKTKLGNLNKNKIALETRMKNFEQKCKESKLN